MNVQLLSYDDMTYETKKKCHKLGMGIYVIENYIEINANRILTFSYKNICTGILTGYLKFSIHFLDFEKGECEELEECREWYGIKASLGYDIDSKHHLSKLIEEWMGIHLKRLGFNSQAGGDK